MMHATRFVLGLCGDELGAIVDQGDWALGRYRTEPALMLAADTAARLSLRARQLLRLVEGGAVVNGPEDR